MTLLSLSDVEEAADFVHQRIAPTPFYAWPLVSQRAGTEVWVKHENHTPTGAFKVRGGLTYMRELLKKQADVKGVISATRGNHGQSIGYAAASLGIPATIFVPRGNSVEKNAAMRAFGVELIEAGDDFEESRLSALSLAEEKGLHAIPSFHEDLARGVSSYAYEMHKAQPDLDAIFVPIGQGSGLCSNILVRDLLGKKTQVIGVVSEEAQSYKLSFEAKRSIPTNTANTIADGMACRVPDPLALEMILAGAERVVSVSEDEIKSAMRALYQDCHNLAEGAGAAAYAALLQEKDRWQGKKVAVVLSGGNVDLPLFHQVLGEAV
ncbi:threonine dehydratase [Rhodovibrionaceae bacterium A322]